MRHEYAVGNLFPGLVPDVSEAIVALLDIHDLRRVRAVSRTGCRYVFVILGTRTRSLLQRYVGHICHFWREMHITNSVIGGEAAHSILYPNARRPKRLFISTPRSTFFHVAMYLVTQEGYQARCKSLMRAAHPNHAEAYLWRGTTVIVLRQAAAHSPLAPLLEGWNTALVCYISPPNAYGIAYAALNQRRIALLPPEHCDVVWASLPKPIRTRARQWRRQGWDVVGSMSEIATRSVGYVEAVCGRQWGACAGSLRYFGDEHSVTGSVTSRGGEIVAGTVCDMLHEYTVMWWRGGEGCGEGCKVDGEYPYPRTVRTCLRNVVDN